MPVITRILTNQFRDVRGRFAAATNEAAVEHSRDHVRRAAEILLSAQRAEVPRGKPDPLGRPSVHVPLYEGLHYVITGGSKGWVVRFEAPAHVRFVIEGTPPHEIRGSAYPLHFFWETLGRECWFWVVQHPGTKPNRFHLRAFTRVRGAVRREVSRGVLYMLYALMGMEGVANV